MNGHKLLVGGCHTLSGKQALLDKCICRLNTSHNLHNDAYIIIVKYIFKIMGENVLDRIPRKLPEIKHSLNVYLLSSSLVNNIMVGVNHFHNS